MASLMRIFDPDYEPEEDVNMGENFGILNEPKMAEPQVKKRKRNDISRNNEGKYQCQQCDYETSNSCHFRTHVEAKHEGVRYTCDQCDYKATIEQNLRRHKEIKHEGVRYPCDKCDYKAGQEGQLKIHKESKHQGVCYSCDDCQYKAGTPTLLKRHVESIHEGVRYPCDQLQRIFAVMTVQYCQCSKYSL